MARETECQTPGAVWSIKISSTLVRVSVIFPFEMDLEDVFDLSEEEAELLEANLHNAVELVLSPYFKR